MTELKDALKKGVVQVTFTKADGAVRTMLCTLNPDLIKQAIGESDTAKVKQDPPGLYTVVDVELNAWRRFKEVNVVSWSNQ